MMSEVPWKAGSGEEEMEEKQWATMEGGWGRTESQAGWLRHFPVE